MNEKIGFDLLGGAHGEFDMGAVHRIAGLEGDDARPSQTAEFSAQFGGRKTQGAKIIMRGWLDSLDGAAHIPRVRLVDGVVGAGMSSAGRIKNLLGFFGAIRLPDIANVKHGNHNAFAIAKRDFARAGCQLLGEFFGHVERDGHGPERAVGEPHVLADAFIIFAVHEAAQRRESAIH